VAWNENWCRLQPDESSKTVSSKSYPLATNGEVRLDNVNGKIRIVTWEQPEIKVDAIKRANTESDLDEVKIEIEAKPDSIRIHTAYPRNRWKLWGEATPPRWIMNSVPANVRLGKVENVNGSLSVAGVRAGFMRRASMAT